MAKEIQKNEIDLTRRGFLIYRENPSLTHSLPMRVRLRASRKCEDAYMVAPGTGEVLAKGAFAFVEEKPIDPEQFVKVYLAGIKQHGQLSKSGAMLFEFVYRELCYAQDKDTIELNYLLATVWKPTLTKPTFYRGMRELLEKEFLYRSFTTDKYFVNVRFMFNGNRVVLVKSFFRNDKKIKIFEGAGLKKPLGRNS